MLMEPILLFFALTGLLCTLKFRAMERGADAKGHAYTARWWAWLLSAGFFLTCSFWCVATPPFNWSRSGQTPGLNFKPPKKNNTEKTTQKNS